jgi:C1A family cysteine protease
MSVVKIRKDIVIGITILFITTCMLPTISIAKSSGITSDSTITSHPATREEIDALKQQLGVYDATKNYNVIIDGHGTGLAPPTETSYETMIGSLQIVDTIKQSSLLPTSADLSADPCFPSVGNQKSQGSCAAWAATYYTVGYVIAKNYNWTQAHTGDSNALLSPAWTYNKCNGGDDYGSSMIGNMAVARTVGVSRLSLMPYNDHDAVSWGTENAWRDAPSYRMKTVYNVPHNITAIKTILTNGYPISYALDAYSFRNFGSDDVLGSDAMQSSLNHGNTIVGYDDLKADNETGEVGAFKMVNSWGGTWGPDHNGYYWMTYQAFLGSWNRDTLNYANGFYIPTTPTLLGVWTLNPQVDRSASVTVGIGDHTSPLQTRRPQWDGSSRVMHQYPEFMCLDITDFMSSWNGDVSNFYLNIGNAAHNGNITSFTVEYYKNSYTAGQPSSISPQSPDTPKITPGYVSTQFRNLDGLEITSIKGGIGVSAIIKNSGTTTLTNVSWSILCNGSFIFKGKLTNGTIQSIAPGESKTVTATILGFGKMDIEARCNQIANVSRTASGSVFLFVVLGVK